MGICEKCGNDYDRTFDVVDADGAQHTFDSMECAISVIAPKCEHCSCSVIGHGVQSGEHVFCCASCAEHAGATGLRDRVPAGAGAG